jgi:transposase
MGRRGYPPEFRRKVLDVARDLQLSQETIYAWRRQDRIDRGLQPGLTTGEKAELAAAKKRIATLEAELATTRRAMELVGRGAPKRPVRGNPDDGR